MIKKILSSLFFGGSIGTGPYVLATQLPRPEIVKADGEGVGFGDRCLLSQEVCDFMKITEFKADEEDKEELEKLKKSPYVQGAIADKLEKDWQDFLQKKDNDYCGFGFYGYKALEEAQQGKGKKVDVNNLDACYKNLIESVKKNQ